MGRVHIHKRGELSRITSQNICKSRVLHLAPTPNYKPALVRAKAALARHWYLCFHTFVAHTCIYILFILSMADQIQMLLALSTRMNEHRCLGNTFNNGFAIVVENDVVVCCCCGVVGY